MTNDQIVLFIFMGLLLGGAVVAFVQGFRKGRKN